MARLDEPFDAKDSPFKRSAQALLDAGYHPIPIMPRDKAPGEYQGAIGSGRWTLAYGWNDFARQKPNDAFMTRWNTWPEANVGIVLGTPVGGYVVVAIDFDTEDEEELEMLRSQLPPSRMQKRGHRGFTAFYRAGKEVRTKRYMIPAPTADKPNAKRTVLEILTGNAARQTVMPPSWHPVGREYEWLTGEGVVPARDLPVLADHHFEQLEDTLEHLGWNGDVAAPTRDRADRDTARDTDDPNIWRDTNNKALQNLDAWAGSLGLPKLRRHPNGAWEAVPTWRSSNEGRDTMQRKPNLKLHSSGIKDMGTDVGYTPLDVVTAALGYDFDNSFTWLRGKLGLNVDGPPLADRPRMVRSDENGTLYDQETGEVIGPVMSESDTELDPDLPIIDEDKTDIAVESLLPPRPSEQIAKRKTDYNAELPDDYTRPPGLLSRLTDYIEASANTPNRVIAFASALSAVGTLLGRKFASPTGSGTNLYILVLSGTGSGKQHGINSLYEMLDKAGAENLKGSGEPMSQTALAKQIEHQPLSCSAIDEFGLFMHRVNGRNSGAHDRGIKKGIMELWGINFHPMQTSSWAATKAETIYAPSFSILAMSTPEEFYNAMETSDIKNGMMNRFLILKTNQWADIKLPTDDKLEMPEDIHDDLRSLYFLDENPTSPDLHRSDSSKAVIPTKLQWADPKTAAYYLKVANEMQVFRRQHPEQDAFFGRAQEMGLRIATIQAMCRDMDARTITIEDLEFGFRLSRWSAENMVRQASTFMSESTFQADSNRIVKLARDAGGMIEHKKLMRLLKNRLKVKDINEIIAGLIDSQAIEKLMEPPPDGGAAKTFYKINESA